MRIQFEGSAKTDAAAQALLRKVAEEIPGCGQFLDVRVKDAQARVAVFSDAAEGQKCPEGV